jgi:DNA primase
VRDAMPLSQFLIKEVIGDNDLATSEGRARTQFDAKPLLQAMPPSALRLQIVRSLAQCTQTTPAEIEALFDLAQPVARARKAPARSARTQPVGLGRQILHLLVAHPLLAAELDQAAFNAVSQVAPDCADMLQQLNEASHAMGAQANFAALAEHLRAGGPDFDPLIVEIAAEPESEIDAARLELAGAVRQSKMKLLKAELDQLAAGGLGTEQARTRYRELMLQQDQLRRQAVDEIAQRQ